MNLGQLYKLILFIANKSQTGGYLSPEEYNMSLQRTNIRLFKSKVANDNEYKAGQPFTKKSPEITQKITEDLKAFKVWLGKDGIPPLYIDSNGYANIPQGYAYPLSLTYKLPSIQDCETEIKTRVIEIVTDSQFDTVAGSYIRKPSKKYPVCNFQNGFIRFAPKDLQYANFNYLRYPNTPIYDYYINEQGEFIYLPPNTSHTLLQGEEGSTGQTSGTVTSLSVELEWEDFEIYNIASMILEMLGINIKDGELTQYSQLMQQQ